MVNISNKDAIRTLHSHLICNSFNEEDKNEFAPSPLIEDAIHRLLYYLNSSCDNFWGFAPPPRLRRKGIMVVEGYTDLIPGLYFYLICLM